MSSGYSQSATLLAWVFDTLTDIFLDNLKEESTQYKQLETTQYTISQKKPHSFSYEYSYAKKYF